MRKIFRKIFRYKLTSIFFIIGQLIIYITIFGALAVYNRAYDKEKDMWVIGFDTFHYNNNIDNCPFEYVKEQTMYLREQCMNVKEVQRILKIKKIINKK